MLYRGTVRAVARTLIGGVYSYIHFLPDQFLFKLINLNLISKETSWAEHEYMNKHTPPPINVLATDAGTVREMIFYITTRGALDSLCG